METFLRRHLNTIVLAVVLLGQLLGLAVQVKRPTEQGSSSLVSLWAVAAVAPIERAFVHTRESISDLFRDYVNLRSVRRENEELKNQLQQMRLEQVRLREDANQARRIQTLLEFKQQYISRSVAAQVIGTSGSEQSRMLYIDKGDLDGVKPNMPVITPNGIVGKVLRTFANTSQVLEISDQTSGVGAMLTNSRLQGILKGATSGDVNLTYIMSDEKVQPGEQVVTSGGDRIFPKGLAVGTVISASPGRDMFLNIRIKPAANLNRVEEVLVLTQIDERAPDTKDLGPIRAADILAERLPSVPVKPPEATPANTTPAGTPNATQPGNAASGPNLPASGVNNKTAATAPGSTGTGVKKAPGSPNSVADSAKTKPNTAVPRQGTAPGSQSTPVRNN